MAEQRLARFNAIAVFPDADAALAALDELRAEGFDNDELSLLAPEQEMAPGARRPRPAPTKAMSGVGRFALSGIGAGAVIGGLLGATLGFLVTFLGAVEFPVTSATAYAGIAGAAAGQIVGGLIAAETGARKSMMWTQTLQPFVGQIEEGMALVGVHTDDPARIDTAEERLGGLGPKEVHRRGADGAWHPPGGRAALFGQSMPSTKADAPGADLTEDEADPERKPRLGVAERGTEEERGYRGDEDTDRR